MLKKIGQFLLQWLGVLAYPFLFIAGVLALIFSPILWIVRSIFPSDNDSNKKA